MIYLNCHTCSRASMSPSGCTASRTQYTYLDVSDATSAPAAFLTREMTQDVATKLTRPVDKTIVLKKGSLMIMDMIAALLNTS